MSLGASIRGGSRWLATGSIGSQLLSFIVGVVLARLLTPADFGAIVTIQIFTGFAGYFAGGGIGEALVQTKKLQESHFHAIFTLQLLIGVALFLSFYFFASWFGEMYDNPLYTDLMRISAITFLTRPFASIPMVKLRRQMRFKEVSIINVLTLIVSSTVSITLALNGMGPWSLIVAGLIGSLFRVPVLFMVAHWLPRVHVDIAAIKRFSPYGLKISANDILTYINSQIANFLISTNGNASSVGTFNKADSLKTIPVMSIGQSVYQPIFRGLSKIQDDKDTSTYIFTRAITLLSVYMLPFYTGLFWTAEPFIGVVYGEKWLPAVEPLQILSLCGLSYCLGNPASAVIAAQNQLTKEIFVSLANFVLTGIGVYLGIKWFGLNGAAGALLLIELNSSFWYSSIATRSLGIRLSRVYRALIPGLILNGILLAALYLSDLILHMGDQAPDPASRLGVMIVVGLTAYAIAFLFAPIPALEAESRRWKDLIAGQFKKRTSRKPA